MHQQVAVFNFWIEMYPSLLKATEMPADPLLPVQMLQSALSDTSALKQAPENIMWELNVRDLLLQKMSSWYEMKYDGDKN